MSSWARAAQLQTVMRQEVSVDSEQFKDWINSLPTPLFNSRIELRPSSLHGQGIHARVDLSPGEILVVDQGVEVDEETMCRASRELGHENNFCIGWGKYLLDAPLNGGAYINHSCEPNAGLENDRTIVAIENISAGSEIFIDYSTFETMKSWEMKCACGTDTCRGTIGGTDHEDPVFRQRLGRWFSPYLKDHWSL